MGEHEEEPQAKPYDRDNVKDGRDGMIAIANELAALRETIAECFILDGESLADSVQRMNTTIDDVGETLTGRLDDVEAALLKLVDKTG
jgi:hypothetical protein